MEKSPEAFRTISEVSEWLDTPAHVLRFWESRFTQVKPVKRAGGRRYYRPSDMALLGGIKKLLHEDGLTIRGVQKILRTEGVRYVAGLSQALDESGPPVLTEEAQDTSPAEHAETVAEATEPPAFVKPPQRPASPEGQPQFQFDLEPAGTAGASQTGVRMAEAVERAKRFDALEAPATEAQPATGAEPAEEHAAAAPLSGDPDQPPTATDDATGAPPGDAIGADGPAEPAPGAAEDASPVVQDGPGRRRADLGAIPDVPPESDPLFDAPQSPFPLRDPDAARAALGRAPAEAAALHSRLVDLGRRMAERAR